jgi:hypothetical protein
MYPTTGSAQQIVLFAENFDDADFGTPSWHDLAEGGET